MRLVGLLLLAWLMGATAAAQAETTAAALTFATSSLTVERQDGAAVPYTVEIARSDAERQQGLMGRRALAPDAGMLFDFGAAQPVAMWMRNTHVALDMLFADADGVIVDVIENTTPLSDALLVPRAPVRYVLELLAGQAAAHGFAPGDRLRLSAAIRTSP